MPKGSKLPHENLPYSSSIFIEISIQVIYMICYLLDYEGDDLVDEVILGFL